MKNNKDTLLSIENLVVEYTAGDQVIHAVNGVSFELERGKTLGLVGETGAGKTSIAKAILRILPDPPARVPEGEICFGGKDLLKISEAEMRKIRGRKISMVFQDPMTALNSIMRVGDQIAEVIKLHDNVPWKEARDRAKEMFKMVNIPPERFYEYPHQFSGGMRQRVVIAMALACRPELLLADEPTTALDVTIQAQVLDMIYKLKHDCNTSMILITHDFGVVAEMCDDVAVIYAGEIIEYGSKEDIFDKPAHPYTLGLFGAIPDINSDARRLNPIPGMPPDPSNLPEGCYFNPRCLHASDLCRRKKVSLREISPGHFCRCINV